MNFVPIRVDVLHFNVYFFFCADARGQSSTVFSGHFWKDEGKTKWELWYLNQEVFQRFAYPHLIELCLLSFIN